VGTVADVYAPAVSKVKVSVEDRPVDERRVPTALSHHG
jgi:hypothetical protein